LQVFNYQDKVIETREGLRTAAIDVRGQKSMKVCFQKLDKKTKRMNFSMKTLDLDDETVADLKSID
jgi:hypothetical protein